MIKVLYPGSFDPIHNGHLDIIEVAARRFDEVVVATVRNPQKGQALFELDERQAMITESVAHLPNVSVTLFSSLVVDLAKEIGADFIVKGLRVVSDFESELMMAQMNHAVSGVDTLVHPVRLVALLPGLQAHPRDRPLRRRRHEHGPRARGQAPRREVRSLMADHDDDLRPARTGARARPACRAPTPSRCSGGCTRWWPRRGPCRCRPRSMINRDEVLDLLDETIARLPDELRAARWLLKEREEYLAKVRREGEEILEQARSRAERMVQRTEVVKASEARARKIVDAAQAEASRLKNECEDYCVYF